jgi:hypothetical protein
MEIRKMGKIMGQSKIWRFKLDNGKKIPVFVIEDRLAGDEYLHDKMR